MRQHDLPPDRFGLAADGLGGIEPNALRRDADPVPDRLGRVAHGATPRDEFDDVVRRRRGGQGSGRRAFGLRRQAQHRTAPGASGDGEDEGGGQTHRGRGPGPPGRAGVVGMAPVVEEADHRARGGDQRDDERDRRLRFEQHRVVVGDHHQDDRQGQVVVLRRALLGLLAEARVRPLPLQQRGDDLALVRDDDEEDVAGHPGRHQGAGMDQCAAAAEHLREAEGGERDGQQADRREAGLALAELRAADAVIDQPAERQRPDAERRRDRGRQVHHRRIDEVEPRLRVVDPGQQHEARQPRRIGLPLVPGEVRGEMLRRDEILAHLVEAAAMHLPGRGAFAGRDVRRPLQRRVEMDEEERRADPGHRRDDVEPAQQQAPPFPDEALHGLSPRCPAAILPLRAGMYAHQIPCQFSKFSRNRGRVGRP